MVRIIWHDSKTLYGRGQKHTMNFVAVFSNKSQIPNGLHMGDFMALWDVAKNKIIGLSTMAIYYRQAKDKELKALIREGVDRNIAKHVSDIQKLLQSKGFVFPLEPNWERKFSNDSRFAIPLSILDDEEIAISLREIIRLTLSLETEGLRNASDPYVKELLNATLDDDFHGFETLIKLQRIRKWSDFPPLTLPQ